MGSSTLRKPAGKTYMCAKLIYSARQTVHMQEVLSALHILHSMLCMPEHPLYKNSFWGRSLRTLHVESLDLSRKSLGEETKEATPTL